ncbi:MAG: MFS transporter, partial [Rhodospirillales bacterium]
MPPLSRDTQPVTRAERLYELAIGADDARYCRDISEDQCREQPRSFLCQTGALIFSKTGDGLADAKIVLPWLLGTVGAPVGLVGLLLPIRESLALFPQILVGAVIRRFPLRKGFWAAASLVEGLCILAMAGVGLSGLTGETAGWAIVGLVVLFSLARGVASIAGKDVLAKTVSKGRRGRVNGLSASIAGLLAGVAGLLLVFLPQGERPDVLLFGLIGTAGLCWLVGAAFFQATPEFPGATSGGRGFGDLLREQGDLLQKDADLRRFLVARTLMIASSLAGPAVVALAQAEQGSGLSELGFLLVSAGIAGAVSSAFWGRFADRSSKAVMALGAGLAGLVCYATILLGGSLPYVYPAALMVLGIAHA